MNSFSFTATFGLVVFAAMGHAGPLDTWTLRSPLLTDKPIYGIAYGNQQFVALTMHFDGKSWSAVPSPSKGIAQQLNGSFAIPGTSHIWSVGEWSTVGIDPENGFFQLPKTFVMVSDKATAP